MPDRVKGITIELNGDVTPLNKALSSANKEIKTTQTALKDVEKLLKLDPKNTELLAQRQRLLAQAVEETKKKLETLKQAEAQAQEQFAKGEISQQQYDALQREIIATEQELDRLEKAAAKSNATLAHIGAVAQEISDKTGEWAEKTRGLSTVAGGVVAALGGMAYSAITASDDLNTLAAQTGFSTEELQKMQYAADRIDVSLETITGAAAKLKRNMASSSKDVTAAWDKLGISVRDANGNLRNSNQVFDEVIKALSEVENETEKDTLAMTLFGRSADQLAGVIDDGGAALKTYGDEAKKAGLILSQDTLNGLNKVNDRLDKLKAQMKGVLAVNGAKVVEAFLPLIESAGEGLGNLAEKVASLDSEQLKTIATIAGVVAGVSPVLSLVSKISGAIAALMPILSSLNAVMLANPAAAVAVGVVALTAAVVAFAKSGKDGKVTAEDLTKAADGLGQSIDNANRAYETQAKDIETTYQKAQPYLKRIEELQKKSELTASEQWEMAHAVEALRDLYPDVNIKIDENTGKLEGNVSQIRAQIQALKDAAIQQALQAKYQGVLDAMADAQIEVYENQIKLRDAQQRLTEAQEMHRIALGHVAEAQRHLDEATDPKSIALWTDVLNEAQLALIRAEDGLTGAQREVDNLSKAIEDGEKKVKEYADEYEAAVSGIAEIMNREGRDAGTQFANGLAKGLRDKIPYVESAARDLARTVPNTTKSIVRVASPSKVAQEIGRFWDEGLVLGMEQGQKSVEDTSADVAQSMIPVQNYSTTNTTNHNVGGIVVNVSTQPGQDVQQIAEAVMEEIQAAVEREGAAL